MSDDNTDLNRLVERFETAITGAENAIHEGNAVNSDIQKSIREARELITMMLPVMVEKAMEKEANKVIKTELARFEPAISRRIDQSVRNIEKQFERIKNIIILGAALPTDAREGTSLATVAAAAERARDPEVPAALRRRAARGVVAALDERSEFLANLEVGRAEVGPPV